MRSKHWTWLCATIVFLLSCGVAMAAGHDHDHDHDHEHGHGHRDHERHYSDDSFSEHDRAYVREWYRDHEDDLPPGLAKRDRLPPGLERQLVERGELPPGLRRRIEPCPEELWRRLPPPPRDCEYVFVSGHLVLLNRRNFVLVTVFHFER